MHPIVLGTSCFILLFSMWANIIVVVWFTYKNIEHLEHLLSDCRYQ